MERERKLKFVIDGEGRYGRFIAEPTGKIVRA
jgi:hypothetical protein